MLKYGEFITYKTLRAIVLLFDSKFFQYFLCHGKLISLQLHVFIKSAISDNPSGSLQYFYGLTQLL